MTADPYARWNFLNNSSPTAAENAANIIDLVCACSLGFLLLLVVTGSSPCLKVTRRGGSLPVANANNNIKPNSISLLSLELKDEPSNSLVRFMRNYLPRCKLDWANAILRIQVAIISLAVAQCSVSFAARMMDNCSKLKQMSFVLFILVMSFSHLLLVKKMRAFHGVAPPSLKEKIVIFYALVAIPACIGLAAWQGTGIAKTVMFQDGASGMIVSQEVCLLSVSVIYLGALAAHEFVINLGFLCFLVSKLLAAELTIKPEVKVKIDKLVKKNVLGTIFHLLVSTGAILIFLGKEISSNALYAIGGECILCLGSVGISLGVMGTTSAAWYWKPLHTGKFPHRTDENELGETDQVNRLGVEAGPMKASGTSPY